jgi:tetratricopeptide (TPR) repeat protein
VLAGYPLFEAPGYEVGSVAALLAAAAAGVFGIAAARRERAGPAPSPAAAAGAGALLAALVAAAFTVGAVARAALGPCSAAGALGFVPALALPSAILGGAAAATAGFLAGGRRARAAALYALFALGALAAGLARAYVGPGAWVSDALLVHWPGPIYDEALAIDARLVLSRLGSAALGAGIAAAAEAVARLRRRAAPALPLAALALALAALAGLRAAGDALGVPRDRPAVARALGGVREGPRCTVHFPAEKPDPAADALLAECEFHAADVAALLGIADPPRVTVFAHRSFAEKRRLVGAAATDFTKPWLAEIHLTDSPLPHPVLRHEVVHAVAAALADGPLRVPARAGVLWSAGLVEGLAVALEVPRSRATVHEWTRAARDAGVLPDVATILSPEGFLAHAPARAYTTAGSFLRFLLDTRGPERVAALYRTGDLAGAMGAPVPALVAEWNRFLDGVEVPQGIRVAARARMGGPSLFAKVCAREAAGLRADAGAAAGAGRAGEAEALYRRAAAVSGSAADLRAAADVLLREGALDRAFEAYREALVATPQTDAPGRAAVAIADGDIAWRRGEVAAAASRYWEVIATWPDRAELRLLQAKLVALSDRDLGPPARDYLLGLGDPAAALARVARVDHPLAAYLVGRALHARGEWSAAAPELARAAEDRGPRKLPQVLRDEAAFLWAEARCLGGGNAAAEDARAWFAARRTEAPAAADRERAAASLRRCKTAPPSGGAIPSHPAAPAPHPATRTPAPAPAGAGPPPAPAPAGASRD